ncbi:MAG: metallophosphoesterase, partial [Flavobacteriaceae bacterium]
MKRRSFLKSSFLLSSSVLIPENFLFNNKTNLKVGIIADVHQDIIFDGTKRIKKFLKDANKLNVDFVIQLGDFALPRKVNQKFINSWNNYKGLKYHVLGNHDM